ncbi:hypothetical protein [Hydrogenobaculum acidophilum]
MRKVLLSLFIVSGLSLAISLHLRTAEGIYGVTTYPVTFSKNKNAYVCIEYNKPYLKGFKPVVINSSYYNGGYNNHGRLYIYVYEGYKPYSLCNIENGFKMKLTYEGIKNLNGYKIINLGVNRIGDVYKHYHKSNILLIYKNNKEIAQINTLTPLQSLKIIDNKIYINQLKTPEDQINNYCFYLNRTSEIDYGSNDNNFAFETLKSCMHNKAIENAYWNGKIKQENPYQPPVTGLIPPFYIQNFYVNK